MQDKESKQEQAPIINDVVDQFMSQNSVDSKIPTPLKVGIKFAKRYKNNSEKNVDPIQNVACSASAIIGGVATGSYVSKIFAPVIGSVVSNTVENACHEFVNSGMEVHNFVQQVYESRATREQRFSDFNRSLNQLQQLRNQMHQHSLNPTGQCFFVGLSYSTNFSFQPRTSYSPYSFQPTFHSSQFNNQSFGMRINTTGNTPSFFQKKEAVYKAVKGELSSSSNPSMQSAYLKAMLSLGLGNKLSLSEFRSIASSANLTSSYNNYHPFAKLSEVSRFCKEIGGVATEVATIEDLVDSDTHALAHDYVLCFPNDSYEFSQSEIVQIAAELFEGYQEQKSLPFFSLHFNDDGFLYPVIHPAYRNTLIGKIIGLLDYWMKCYLNGGFFDESILTKWHETCNKEDTYLRSILKDFKQYFKQENSLKGIPYFSLREWAAKYGIKEKSGGATYKQQFMTSFRIISYLKDIQREENILIPEATFRIDYTIDLMPDYKEELEAYCKEHGHYPSKYVKLKQCYEDFAKELTKKLPLLPFTKPFFKLLEVTTSLSYFYSTLNTMAKIPIFSKDLKPNDFSFPKALPPIPVRYHKSFPLNLTLLSLLKRIHDEKKGPELDCAFSQLINEKFSGLVPQDINQLLRPVIIKIVEENLIENQIKVEKNTQINEDEVDKILSLATQSLVGTFIQIKAMSEKLFRQYQNRLNKSATLGKNYSEKREKLNSLLHERIEYLTKKWQASPQQTEQEFLVEFEGRDYQNLRKHFVEQVEEIKGYPKEIPALLPKLEKQLSEATSHLKRIEDELSAIAKNRARCKQQIVVEDKTLTLDEYENLLKEGQKELPGVISTLQQKITRFRNFNIPREILEFAITSMSRYYSTIIEIILRLSKRINHFTKSLLLDLLLKPDSSKVLAKDYVHTYIGFTNKELAQQIGDTFHIVGGCGLSLPSLKTEPILYPERVKQAIEAIQDFGKFEINGKSYSAWRIPVIDKHIYDEVVASQEEQEIELLELEKDISGCNLVHYAAAFATVDEFQKIISDKQPIVADTFGNLPIHVAACEKNIEILQWLVKTYPEQVEVKTKSGMTPLLMAAEKGNLSAVEALCQSNLINVNYRLPNGLFALYLAIQNKHDEVALYLLSNVLNIGVNFTLDNGMTCLHKAIENDMDEVAAKLIQKGASLDIKRKADGFTPYHLASKLGKTTLVEKMLAAKISIDCPLESKKTALHLAVVEGHVELVKFLIVKGANPDIKTVMEDTPLMLAIENGCLEVALILAEKAKINVLNKFHQSASLLALRAGLSTVADILFARGEAPFLVDKNGHDCLYYLAVNGDYYRFSKLITPVPVPTQIEAVPVPAKASIEPTKLNKLYNGNSLLAIAAKHGQFALVELLLDHSVSFKSSQSFELIHYAVMADEIGFATPWLLSNNVDKAKVNGQSLTYLAAKHGAEVVFNKLFKSLSLTDIAQQQILKAAIEGGSNAIVEKVLLKSVDLNIVLDELGQTALHIAVKTGAIPIVKLLLERGCNPCVINRAKQSIFHIALFQEDKEMFKFLMKNISSIDWPIDLDQKNVPLIMQEHLNSYFNELVRVKRTANEHKFVNKQKKEDKNETIKSQTSVDEILFLIRNNEFDLVAGYIESNQELITILLQDKSIGLLQHLFQCIQLPLQEETNDLMSCTPDTLLNTLRQVGYTLKLSTGENNVLLTLLQEDDEKVIDYKLDLLKKFFEKELSVVILDEITPGKSFVQRLLSLGKLNLFRKIIEICPTVNFFYSASADFLPLHEAVAANNFELTEYLIKKLPVDMQNSKCQTALMVAAEINNVQILQLLVESGANVEAVDIYGHSALHHAVICKMELAASFLLSLTKNKDKPDRDGKTVLMFASGKGLINIVQMLCASGINPDAISKHGWNALHYAAHSGHETVIKYLLDAGFEINQSTKEKRLNPLLIAANAGKVHAVKMLIELGADPTFKDENGYTYVERSIISKDPELINFIKQLPQYHQKERDTSLVLAASVSNNESVLTELENSVNFAVTDKDGHTPLHLAVINGSLQTTEILLNSEQVFVDQLNRDGRSALHYAAIKGSVASITQLLSFQAEINLQDIEGQTPLYLACKNGKLGAVLSLLASGANKHLSDHKGIEPSKAAANNGHFEIARRVNNFGLNENKLDANKVSFFNNKQTNDIHQGQAINQYILETNNI